MYAWLKNTALSHRAWISAGALCLGAAIVVGYHEDQLAANRILAGKVGLPGTVMVQDFRPELHSNDANEIAILAEAGVSFSTRVEASETGAPRYVDVVPIFSVSRDGYPLAQKWLHDSKQAPRRPMPRSDAPVVRETYEVLRKLEAIPLGFFVRETDGPDLAAALGANAIGDGANGPLISVFGSIGSGTVSEESMAAALATRGVPVVPGMLYVEPYVNGREAALAAPDFRWLRRVLTWTGFAAIVSAFVMLGSGSFLRPRRRRTNPPAPVPAAGGLPPVSFFQPIKTQEELMQEDDELQVRTRRTSRVVSRIMDRAGETFAADRVRSQL